MSFQATKWAWTVKLTARAVPIGNAHKGVNVCAQRLVLLLLADQANHHGGVFSSHRYLAHTTGLSRPTVQRALSALTAAGLLEVDPGRRKNGRHTSNTYNLRLDAGDATAGAAPTCTPDPDQAGDFTGHPQDARSVDNVVDNLPAVHPQDAGGASPGCSTGCIPRMHHESISINLDQTGRSEENSGAMNNVVAMQNNVAPPQTPNEPPEGSNGGDGLPNAPTGASEHNARAGCAVTASQTAPDGAIGSAGGHGAAIGEQTAVRAFAAIGGEFHKRFGAAWSRSCTDEQRDRWLSQLAMLTERQIRHAMSHALAPQCQAPPSPYWFTLTAMNSTQPPPPPPRVTSARHPGAMPISQAATAEHKPTDAGRAAAAAIRARYGLDNSPLPVVDVVA